MMIINNICNQRSVVSMIDSLPVVHCMYGSYLLTPIMNSSPVVCTDDVINLLSLMIVINSQKKQNLLGSH